MKNFISRLLEPTSKNEDIRRKEFILNVLLLGSLVLTLSTLITSIISVFLTLLIRNEPYNHVTTLTIFIISIFFGSLYLLSKKGFAIIASYILIFVYLVPTLFTSLSWGVEVPQGLLTYALIIVMAGILISTRFAWVITCLISVFLLIISYLHSNNVVPADISWRSANAKITDVAIFIVSLGIITLVSWLSNREIERSLRRARKSEAALKKERDLLEIRVEERTKQLKEAEIEKITQLTRFAEFGRLASGVFHDLANPLTAISLNLEQVSTNTKKDLMEAKPYIAQALDATKRMEEFFRLVKKQIQQQEVKEKFEVNTVLNEAIKILEYKARINNVQVLFVQAEKIYLIGNSLRFLQVITNLVSNAIDAYTNISSGDKEVTISAAKLDRRTIITISDQGKGIRASNIEKIFDPFYTTKTTKEGMGIGLSIVKSIIESDFSGSITVESKPEIGSTFTINLPLSNE